MTFLDVFTAFSLLNDEFKRILSDLFSVDYGHAFHVRELGRGELIIGIVLQVIFSQRREA